MGSGALARFGEWRELRTWRRQLRGQARCAAQSFGLRWWREPIAWLKEHRRRRMWIKAGVQLERLRRRAVRGAGDGAVSSAIDEANAIFANLEAFGVVTRTERVELGRSWVRAYARDRVGSLYRAKDAMGVAQLTWFLKAG